MKPGMYKDRLNQINRLLKNETPWSDRYNELTDEAMNIERNLLKEDDAVNALLDGIRVARPAIIKHIEANGNKHKDVSSSIDCPVCEDGVLSYGYAGSYNKHVHAKCSSCSVGWGE